MNPARFTAICLCALAAQVFAAENEPPPFNAQARPNRNRPGPWANEVLVYRAAQNDTAEKFASFPRAGVPTMARLKDGRLVAAHQHFPADNDTDFDKVAVHFSSDEGRTWTPPDVIRLEDLPARMRFPFDPTLVPLPDGRVRLYFTSRKQLRFDGDPPAIYSAVSSNSIDFVFEPGMRFGVEGRPVIDCAVALHNGVFHLFAPDNGAGNNPGAPQREQGDRPSEGVGYHATSKDGLNFSRRSDVRMEAGRRWLGNAQSDGDAMRFFGTGGPGGIWTATSADGESWMLDDSFPRVPGADPGAVKLQDGTWLLAATGPPRDRRPQEGPRDNFAPSPRQPLINALDANDDGAIDEWEIENASRLLRRLDRNRDGRLTSDELRPMRPDGDRDPNSRNPRPAPQPGDR